MSCSLLSTVASFCTVPVTPPSILITGFFFFFSFFSSFLSCFTGMFGSLIGGFVFLGVQLIIVRIGG